MASSRSDDQGDAKNLRPLSRARVSNRRELRRSWLNGCGTIAEQPTAADNSGTNEPEPELQALSGHFDPQFECAILRALLEAHLSEASRAKARRGCLEPSFPCQGWGVSGCLRHCTATDHSVDHTSNLLRAIWRPEAGRAVDHAGSRNSVRVLSRVQAAAAPAMLAARVAIARASRSISSALPV